MIRPIKDLMTVRKIEVKTEVTAGGIYVGEAKQESPYVQGEILALGDFDKMNEILSVGDTIVYNSYEELMIPIGTEKTVLIPFSSVLGKIISSNITPVET